MFKSPLEGAQTSLYCATAPLNELEPGQYYHDCHKGLTSRLAKDDQEAKRLWELSEQYVSETKQ